MRNVRSGFWVALVIALLVTAHAYWDFFESRRLRTRLEAVKASAQQPPFASAPRLSGDAADADRFYRAASVLAGGFQSSASPQADFQLKQALRQDAWPPDLVPVLRARLEEQRDALTLIDRAARLPFEGFQAGWRPAYGAGAYIALQRLCEMRAVERTLAGDGDGAFDSLYADVRLERVVGHPPMFAGLTFVAGRAKPSEAARSRLTAALAEIDRDDRLQQTFVRLRAQLFESNPVGRQSWLGAPYVQHIVSRELDTFAELIDAAGRPQAERVNAVNAVGAWPIGFANRNEQGRALLESVTRQVAAEMERIKCARRLVAGEMVDCLR